VAHFASGGSCTLTGDHDPWRLAQADDSAVKIALAAPPHADLW